MARMFALSLKTLSSRLCVAMHKNSCYLPITHTSSAFSFSSIVSMTCPPHLTSLAQLVVNQTARAICTLARLPCTRPTLDSSYLPTKQIALAFSSNVSATYPRHLFSSAQLVGNQTARATYACLPHTFSTLGASSGTVTPPASPPPDHGCEFNCLGGTRFI